MQFELQVRTLATRQCTLSGFQRGDAKSGQGSSSSASSDTKVKGEQYSSVANSKQVNRLGLQCVAIWTCNGGLGPSAGEAEDPSSHFRPPFRRSQKIIAGPS